MNSPGEDRAWDALNERVTIMLRPIGAATALGFFGLAAAALLLSGLQLGWVEQSESSRVGLLLLALPFGAQLLAALFSFLARDGAMAGAMAVLSLTWLALGLTLLTSAPGSESDALGLLLLMAGSAVVLSGITAASGKLVPAVVLLVAGTRLLAAALYELTAADAWQDASGVIGLPLAALALYAAFAADLEDARGQTVLPLGRRAGGKTAMEGTLLEQVQAVATEPGVRTQL